MLFIVVGHHGGLLAAVKVVMVFRTFGKILGGAHSCSTGKYFLETGRLSTLWTRIMV